MKSYTTFPSLSGAYLLTTFAYASVSTSVLYDNNSSARLFICSYSLHLILNVLILPSVISSNIGRLLAIIGF